MHFTRAKAVTAATVAALSGLTAVALAAGGGTTPSQSAAAPTTPIEYRTQVVDRTVHRTETVNEDANGNVVSVHATDGPAQDAVRTPTQPATPAPAPVVQRAPAVRSTALAEDEDHGDDHYEDHSDDRGGEHRGDDD